MFESALELIRKYDTVILHRHQNPDGDAIGSQVGLCLLLRENFPGKKVYCVGDPAGRFSFIEGSRMDEIRDETYRGALAVVLDTSSASLISDARWKFAERTLRFDHHVFLERICDTEIADRTYESCAGLIADFARESGLSLSPAAAKALYTGMVTDSGRFRYDSVSARTFALASFLLSQKFNPQDIFSKLYAEDYAGLALRAKFILKIRFTSHNVAYIYTEKEEISALGAEPFAISRGMVGTMADLRGVDIWVNFTEVEEGVWCEIRSSKYNINPVAVRFGGGGHQKASGCTLRNREEAMKLLSELDAMTQQQ